MEITLKNFELVPAIELLQKMELPANESRPVVKFTKLLNEALQEVQESQMKLIEQYGQKNDEGELVLTDDGTDYVIAPDESHIYEEQLRVFLDEDVVINGGAFVNVVAKLPDVLRNYDAKISGRDAVIYDRLFDEFEKEEMVEDDAGK